MDIKLPEKIGQKAVESVTDQASTGSLPNVGEPDPAALGQFNQAMAGPGESQPAGPAQGGSGPEGVTQPQEATLGDKVLAGLDKLRSENNALSQNVEQLATGEGTTLTAAKMLDLQFKLNQWTMQQQVVSKVAEKTITDADTLLKQQG